jgi:hypothetical protein
VACLPELRSLFASDLLKPGTPLEVFDGRRESMSGSCCVVW